jgi:serpin B
VNEVLVCAAALGVGLSGCTVAHSAATVPAPVCSAPQATSSAASALASGDTGFAVALYGPATESAGAGQNAIMSPFSASAALTMVDVGAAGDTATQMQTVLQLPDTGANVAPAYAALACEDETDGSSQGNQLSIANALWAQQGKAFEASFLSVLSTGYDAPLQQVDFAGDSEGAVAAINQWVSSETQAKIPSLLAPSDVSSATELVLVNAVYFNGVWDVGFDANSTSPRSFTLSDGTTASVPTMEGTVNLAVGIEASQNLAVYELPYKGRSMVMDFLLPSGLLSAFEESLTADVLNGALASVGSSTQVILDLPKFAFTTHLALVPILTAMGMTDVFDPTKANLSGMDGAMDLYVSTVVQEALVEVDEQGTVAAAATAVSVNDNAATQEPERVAIDHPFLFLIRDKGNGSILFMGRVEDPRAD